MNILHNERRVCLKQDPPLGVNVFFLSVIHDVSFLDAFQSKRHVLILHFHLEQNWCHYCSYYSLTSWKWFLLECFKWWRGSVIIVNKLLTSSTLPKPPTPSVVITLRQLKGIVDAKLLSLSFSSIISCDTGVVGGVQLPDLLKEYNWL